jgi:energy-coupling factor transporter ATP-binding protein EcfA2
MEEIKSNMHHIKSIKVTGLFGRYTYQLPAEGQTLSDLNIVYGENGVGKTTLLTLVFNSLSPATNKGHRHRIADTPFKHLEIHLVDGTKITATKDKQLLTGPVLFAITTPDKSKIQWRFIPGPSEPKFPLENLPQSIDPKQLPADIRKDVVYAIEKRDFFVELSKLKVDTFMLTADRILLGDKVQDAERLEAQFDRARNRGRVADLIKEYRVAAVREALSNASAWLQRRFLERSYAPRNSIDPYQDIVNKIASTTYKTKSGLNKIQAKDMLESLAGKIESINDRITKHSKFGISSPPISPELVAAIYSSSGNKLNLISTILSPYLDGLDARLSSLAPTYDLTAKFIETVNSFLRDKSIEYSITGGLKIVINDDSIAPQEIDPTQLSSGEQQLILLFCHVLSAQDTSSLIIIDEPEISLNVMWQRMLVSSLHTLSRGANIQFIFASHSLELLSKHRSRVISMQESK